MIGHIQPLGSVMADPHAADPSAPADTALDAPVERILSADEAVESRWASISEKWRQFEQSMAVKMREYARVMAERREQLFNFSSVYPLCERRAATDQVIVVDEFGEVVLNAGDGHAKMRTSFGLAASAIRTLHGPISNYLSGIGQRPNLILSKGIDDESPDREQILSCVIDDQHDGAGFDAVLHDFIQQILAFPCAVIRQRWVAKSRVQRDEDGRLRRCVHFNGADLRSWPLPNVLFSDPEKPRAEDQRFVIWYDRPTLLDLESEELRYEAVGECVPDPVTGFLVPAQVQRVEGRFFNLEPLRIEAESSGRSNSWAQQDYFHMMLTGQAVTREVDKPAPLVAKQFGRFQGEGYIDFGEEVRNGILCHEIIALLVETAGWPEDLLTIGSKRELIRRLNEIFWNITTVHTDRLIELRPCPYNPPRNTAIVAFFLHGKGGIYGHGVVQAGESLERQIDRLVNDNLWISTKRANPNWIADRSATLASDGTALTDAQINALLNGVGRVIRSSMGGVQSVKDMLMELRPDANSEWANEVAFLVEQYKQRTLADDVSRGEISGATATETSNAMASSSMRILDVAKRIAVAIVQIDRNILSDLGTFMRDPDEFLSYLTKVAGKAGLKAWYLLPTSSGLCDQVRVEHSGVSSRNREVRIAQFQACREFWAPTGVANTEAMLRMELSLLDIPDVDSLLASGAQPIDPRQEVKSLAQGHYVRPHQHEDPYDHYAVHYLQLLAIAPDVAMTHPELFPSDQILMRVTPQMVPGMKPPGLENFRFDASILTPQLIRHLEETLDIIRMLEAVAQSSQVEMDQRHEAEEEQAGAEEDERAKAGEPQRTTETTVQDDGSMQTRVRTTGAKPPMSGMLQNA